MMRGICAIGLIRESRSFRVIRERASARTNAALVNRRAGWVISWSACSRSSMWSRIRSKYSSTSSTGHASLWPRGYGDIYLVTDISRMVTMLSSLVGVALVAFLTDILAGGYMDEVRKESALS